MSTPVCGLGFKLTNLLAQTARRRPELRRPAALWWRLRAALRGGGPRLAAPDEVFRGLLAELGRVPQRPLEAYIAELRDDRLLAGHFEAAARAHNHNLAKFADWNRLIDASTAQIALFYATLREIRPRVVIETGTATGSMTAIELSALHRNGEGRLVSIDLPPVDGALTMHETVKRADVGFFIPEAYRGRWEYRMGDAKLLLPAALAELDPDVFIHDSLHTRSHMVFEYAAARALMRPETLILSDDVSWNNGFEDFLALNRLTGYVPFTNPNIAGFANRFDAFETETGLGIVRS